MIEFRWTTKVLTGPWMSSHNLALMSAVDYGQACINHSSGSVATLKNYTVIEERVTEQV